MFRTFYNASQNEKKSLFICVLIIHFENCVCADSQNWIQTGILHPRSYCIPVERLLSTAHIYIN